MSRISVPNNELVPGFVVEVIDHLCDARLTPEAKRMADAIRDPRSRVPGVALDIRQVRIRLHQSQRELMQAEGKTPAQIAAAEQMMGAAAMDARRVETVRWGGPRTDADSLAAARRFPGTRDEKWSLRRAEDAVSYLNRYAEKLAAHGEIVLDA